MQTGTFYWYELATSDPQAAADFYGKVIGWHFVPQPAAPPGMTYLIGMAGDHPGAAIMSYRSDMPEPDVTRWWGSVRVEDVDAVVARIEAAGGKVVSPPANVPDIERAAAVLDPQGSGFMLSQPEGTGEMPPAPPYMTPGTVGWHELVAKDWGPMFDLYAGLFGWEKDTALDMGGMGTYQLVKMGDAVVGAMMSAQGPQPTGWTFYFGVEDIDAAKARLEDAGGTVLMGPQEVPGPIWILHATDPQGGRFALVGPRK